MRFCLRVLFDGGFEGKPRGKQSLVFLGGGGWGVGSK